MELSASVRQEYPFASRYHDLGGLRLHYIEEGQGQPVLMVHGNPTWSFMYRKMVSDFAKDSRALAVDHIGMGLSDKPQNYRYRLARHIANLEDFVLAKDLRNVRLIVHDWGGPIGLGVAVRHPDRFERIVISNTAGFRSQRMPSILKVARVPMLGEMLIRGFNAFVWTASHTALEHRERMRGAVREGYFAPYNSWANRIATARFVQDVPMDTSHPSYGDLLELERGLVKLREKPILLLWGVKDWCFPPHFRDRFQEFFPEAKIVNFPNAGHLVYEDEPEQSLAAIREFFR